ncbi:MAG: hypothetical protein Q9160_004700 [Pyrenula sp. 1 TL-2023]
MTAQSSLYNVASRSANPFERSRLSRGEQASKPRPYKDSSFRGHQSRIRATDLSPELDLSVLSTLPPLRQPPQPQEVFSSPPNRVRSHSGAYYAAAWGSPYATPSPPRPSIAEKRANTLDGTFHDISPSSARSGVSRASSRGIANLLSITARGPLNKFARPGGEGEPSLNESPEASNLLLSSRSERGNWLSDSEGSAKGSRSGNKRDPGSESPGWLGLGEDSPNEDDVQTPTVKRFTDRRPLDARKLHASIPLVNHKPHDSLATVKQDDFSDFVPALRPLSSPIARMDIDAKASPASEIAANIGLEIGAKPLPNLPSERVGSDSTKSPYDTGTRPPLPNAQSFQRPKKRIICKGKACIIALPLNDERGCTARLLSPADVAARMQQWESQGFNTEGFSLNPHWNGEQEQGSASQSRSLFPDPNEVQHERISQSFKVRIPKKAEWEAWIRHLKEEKLRALGVTFGDEEPVRKAQSPMSGPMSRSSSHQPNLPISPPVPSSTTSSHVLQGFSPAFNLSTNSNSQQGSIGSPSSQYSLHRQQPSIAIPPADKRNASPFGPNFQPGLPAGRFNSPGYFSHGGVSPMGPVNMKNLGEVLSPVSPFQMDERNGSPRSENIFNQTKQQQPKEFVSALSSQPQLQPQMSSKTFGPQADSWRRGPAFNEIIGHSDVEIAHPTPGRHNRNVSEALEREIDGAEDPLEMAIRKQLQNPEDKKPSMNQETPLVDTNPDGLSDIGSPAGGKDFEQKGLQIEMDGSSLIPKDRLQPHIADDLENGIRPLDASTHGHRIKPSVSGLNVQAKEFSFNPTATFTPGNFAFTSSNFNAPTKGFNSSIPNSNSRDFSSARSSSATHPTSFNVEAPAFKPSRQADDKPSTTGFKFGSGLKVDAPVFNPSLPSFNASALPQSQLKESSPTPRIFGEFKFEGPAKTSRRSKAVPIVPPDDSDNGRQSSDELEEDEEGRLGPSEAYRKRVRRVGSDGERIVSLPGSPTEPEVKAMSLPAEKTEKDQSPSLEGKANNVPDDLDASFDQEDSRSAVDPSNLLDVHTNATDQEETKGNADLSSMSVPDKANGTPTVGLQNRANDEQDEVSELEDKDADVTDIPSTPPSPPPKHVSQSSLSATAQPFEPNTYLSDSSGQWSQSGQMRSQPNENTKPPRRETSGLASSRYAPVEPSSSDSELEEAMERMLDLQEASHAIKNGSLSETEPPSSDQLSQAVPSSETEAPSKLTATLSSTSALAAIPHEPAEISPSFTEIDAVMKQLNEADSELGIERSDEHLPDLASSPVLQPPAKLRSDAPSPSPQRIQSLRPQHIPQDSTDIDLQSPQFPLGLGIQAPVQKLNKQLDDNEASDWNEMLSSADEGKFFSRTQFFDGHVNSLVGGIMDDRMAPLERSIDAMQKHLGLLVSSRRERINTEVMPSDADDEDDGSDNITPYRSRSPPRRRARSRGDEVKKAVSEALKAHEEAKPQENSTLDLSRIYEVLAEMKMLAEPGALQDRAKDMRTVIEDVISTHPRLRGNRASHDQEHGVDKMKLQVDGLETMLKLANERAEEEYQARKEVDVELAETKRFLTSAEEEAARHREASEEAERSLHVFYAERQEYDDLQISVSELSLKNAALETTLEEYRLSHDQWRSDIDDERAANKELRGTMHNLKKQIYESHDARQGLRGKFERLQEDMANAARDIANDHATWSRREYQLQAQIDQLSFVLDREKEQNQSSSNQLQQLQKDHEDVGRLRHSLDQSQNEQARLEELVNVLQAENKQHQGDIYSGQIQFESQLARLQSELESSRLDADRAKARQEDLLTDAIETKKRALSDATQTREDVLQEQSRFHERALNDLRERHARVLHNSTEDRERAERHLQDKLDLSFQKNEFLEDRVAHLEERLEVTKAAAKAAADAAASRGATVPSVVSPPRSSMASMPFAKGTDIPEKISPQALRESIMVLQEQLQNREQSIEHLEQELGKVDKEAPEKLKARDTEITWLRELLGVRLDDLQDIIVTLAQPDFNREAVKDAAIRLKANLQMEQQVKERAGISSGLSQGISSITNLTQSPSRLPMAAAAAWGNWRKGAKDLPFSSTLSDIASIASQTPSRTNNSPQSFLSGLMTPPATNQRQTPTPSSTRTTGPPSLPPSARPLRAYGSAPRSLSTRQLEKRPLRDFSGSPTSSRSPLEPPEPPQTPPLLRKASYDQDASEASSFSAYGDDDQSTIDGRD